ncbi:MAG TPA: hypothetical protein VKN36_16760 [Eudoraea sp.]|nr:hypothetical protein [Eudoraea sp.]
MKRIFGVLLAISTIVIGCTDKDDDVNAVNIRIKNTSNLTYDEVQVGDAEKMHMNVAPEAYSDYLIYETAYRYAFVEIRSGAETYTLQPIDFVGESELPIGFYTYELNVSEEGDVELEFVID